MRPLTFFNIFCKTTGPIDAKLHIKPPFVRKTKVCWWDLGDMTTHRNIQKYIEKIHGKVYYKNMLLFKVVNYYLFLFFCMSDSWFIIHVIVQNICHGCGLVVMPIERSIERSSERASERTNERSIYLSIYLSTQLAFYVNLHRTVIGPSATLTGRWRPDIDLRRMLTGYLSIYLSIYLSSTIPYIIAQ